VIGGLQALVILPAAPAARCRTRAATNGRCPPGGAGHGPEGRRLDRYHHQPRWHRWQTCRMAGLLGGPSAGKPCGQGWRCGKHAPPPASTGRRPAQAQSVIARRNDDQAARWRVRGGWGWSCPDEFMMWQPHAENLEQVPAPRCLQRSAPFCPAAPLTCQRATANAGATATAPGADFRWRAKTAVVASYQRPPSAAAADRLRITAMRGLQPAVRSSASTSNPGCASGAGS